MFAVAELAEAPVAGGGPAKLPQPCAYFATVGWGSIGLGALATGVALAPPDGDDGFAERTFTTACGVTAGPGASERGYRRAMPWRFVSAADRRQRSAVAPPCP